MTATLALALLLGAVLPSSAASSIVARIPLEALQARSDVVTIGRVISTHAAFVGRTIQTETVISVQRSFRGPGSGTISVVTAGGSVGDTRLTVLGVPSFTVGERVLVFLRRGSSGLEPVGMFQGVWRLPELTVRGLRGIDDPEPRMAWPSSPGGATLVDLEPGPYAVDGGPRTMRELLGSLIGGTP